MESFSITSGTSFCENISEIGEVLGTEDTKGTRAIFGNLGKILNRDHLKDDELPTINVEVTKSDCFGGEDPDVVGNAECTPWVC